MPKNFEDFKSQQENYTDFKQEKPILNPNENLNEATIKEIRHKNQVIYGMTLIGRALTSIITAPLTTIQVSLQLSVLAHQNKYGDLNEFEKTEIMKVPKEITPYEKRRYELIVKSGVTGANKPFRAPVYLTYKEAFKALSNQGFLGFYKGNLIGFTHIWLTTYMKFNLSNALRFRDYTKARDDHPIFKGIYVFTAVTFADIILHPIQTMQSRFILQNRLPNFRLYKSAFHFFRKQYRRPRVLYQGWKVHLPKNILFTLGQMNMFKNDPFLSFLAANIVSQTLAYPLTTIMRRLQCQDTHPGMLPVRYSGAWHAFKLILNEEGFRGLFRGYFAFLPAHLITSFTVLSLTLMGEQTYNIKHY